ncbi:hypothetical protein ACLOJK_031000 [Asimina triloba]
MIKVRLSDECKLRLVYLYYVLFQTNILVGLKMSSPSKRRDTDVMKLMMSDYAVETVNDGTNEFNVEFHGPKESLYEGEVWKIRVKMPEAYPFKSPSFSFLNKIFHPNVNEHPLNRDAASLMMNDPKQYEQKVKEYCELYAKKENIVSAPAEESGEDDASDCESTGSSDGEVSARINP